MGSFSRTNATQVMRKVVAVAMVIGAGAQMGAQTPPVPSLLDAWVPDGEVYAIAESDGITYLGGYFNYVGPATGSGVPLDQTTGRPAATFPRVNGEVAACVSDGAGGWFIGGQFSQLDTTERPRLAHILADGTTDPNWNPGLTNGGCRALALVGGTLYVAGDFYNIGGQPIQKFAGVDAVTGAVLPHAAPRFDGGGSIHAIAASGNTVFVGGTFTEFGAVERKRLAAFDHVTGELLPWNPVVTLNLQPGESEGGVRALAVAGNTLYVGGGFATIGGQYRAHIGAVDATTGAVTSWAPGADSWVTDLVATEGTVYAAGGFHNIGGRPRNGFAALSTSSSTLNATRWDPAPDLHVFALAMSGDKLFVGGDFQNIGGQPRRGLAAFDASGTLTEWDPSVDQPVSTLAGSGSSVYAGGTFTMVGGKARRNLAALDRSGAATDWNPGANSSVGEMLIVGDKLIVGGNFTQIAGQERGRIAMLDAATGNATAWNPRADGYISTLTVTAQTLYVGGSFTHIGGQPRNNIAALDLTTGNASAWNPNADEWVYDIALHNSTVFVVGSFKNIGGQPRNGLAALDSSGAATSWNPQPDGRPLALAISGSTVYVGGTFTAIGGQTRYKIAALDAVTAVPTVWAPRIAMHETDYPSYGSAYVNAIAVAGRDVIIGGEFGHLGGLYRRNLGSANEYGHATLWNPSPERPVHTLFATSDRIHVGGGFKTMELQPRAHYASFDIPDPVAPTPIPPPPAPGSISHPSASDSGRYTVWWTPATRATAYELERSANGGISWVPIYNGPSTTFAERAWGVHRYRVRATNETGASPWTAGTLDCVVTLVAPGTALFVH